MRYIDIKYLTVIYIKKIFTYIFIKISIKFKMYTKRNNNINNKVIHLRSNLALKGAFLTFISAGGKKRCEHSCSWRDEREVWDKNT